MKSTTIASESTKLFYVKLKTSPTPDWYIDDFDKVHRKLKKLHLDKKIRKQEFLINRIGFYRKHVWFHFNGGDIDGWLPFKSIRNNYRRLVVPLIKADKNDKRASYLAAIKMMLEYQTSAEVVDRALLPLSQGSDLNLTPQSFVNVILNSVGSFRNISDKSLRRVRNQLRRQRPVIVWGHSDRFIDSNVIVLVGFNKRLFYCNDPISGQQFILSKKQFMKYWRSGDYQAFSY